MRCGRRVWAKARDERGRSWTTRGRGGSTSLTRHPRQVLPTCFDPLNSMLTLPFRIETDQWTLPRRRNHERRAQRLLVDLYLPSSDVAVLPTLLRSSCSRLRRRGGPYLRIPSSPSSFKGVRKDLRRRVVPVPGAPADAEDARRLRPSGPEDFRPRRRTRI